MKVLVIDDSDLARAQLRRLLVRAGIETFEQPSAIGATRTILRHGIDVALVDVTMPGLSGDKLVSLLRNNPRLKGLLVVLVSAKSWEELQSLARETRADAVLSKSRVETDLVPLLQQLMAGTDPNRRERRRGACVK